MGAGEEKLKSKIDSLETEDTPCLSNSNMEGSKPEAGLDTAGLLNSFEAEAGDDLKSKMDGLNTEAGEDMPGLSKLNIERSRAEAGDDTAGLKLKMDGLNVEAGEGKPGLSN